MGMINCQILSKKVKLTYRSKKCIAGGVVSLLAVTILVIGLSVGLTNPRASLSEHRHEKKSLEAKEEEEKKVEKVPTEKTPIRNKHKAPFDSQFRSYPSAAVTSDTNVCSKIGADILRSGNGSSVDAAIATKLCVGLVNMQSTGIGGGFFATIYERPRGQSEKVLVSLIARERAPLAAKQDMYANGSVSSTVGGMAVAVPGEIKGYYEAWKMFGRMSWSDLFQPVIRMCEEGYLVEKELAAQIRSSEATIRLDPNFRELLVKDDGTLLQEGDLLVNLKLGATMRRIAADPLTYYNGTLAVDIVADINDYGGIITIEDLNVYKVSFKTPLNVSIQNGQYTLYNPPPPASGAVMDFILNVLDGFNFNPLDVADDASTILTYHRIIEAFKFAYAKRSNLGDEDFVNVTELIYNLTSDSYAESIRLQIDDIRTHDIDYYGPTFDFKPDSGTSHLNVLAEDGAAVVMTGTINLIFGAIVRGNRTGIVFNNEMDDFSTPGTRNAFGVPASPTNYIEPGKIPMSSMTPTLIFDRNGSIAFLSGSSGGTRITTSTAFVTMNALWFGLDLKNATDEARIHHQLVPNQVYYESWLDQNIVSGLAAKNHTLIVDPSKAVVGSVYSSCGNSSVSASTPDARRRPNADDCIAAVSDGRKGGQPDGF